MHWSQQNRLLSLSCYSTHKVLFQPGLIQLYSNVRLLLAAFIRLVLNLLPTSFYRSKDD